MCLGTVLYPSHPELLESTGQYKDHFNLYLMHIHTEELGWWGALLGDLRLTGNFLPYTIDEGEPRVSSPALIKDQFSQQGKTFSPWRFL